MLQKKAQITLEYLIVLGVFIATVVVVSIRSLKPGIGRIFTQVAEDMTEKVESCVGFSQF
jgi:Flp pilus assembly pilin Flp